MTKQLSIPKRDPNDVTKAKPSEGDHKTQVGNASKKSFERYEDAYRKLADKRYSNACCEDVNHTPVDLKWIEENY